MSANIPGFHVQMKWIGKPSGIKKKRLRNIVVLTRNTGTRIVG